MGGRPSDTACRPRSRRSATAPARYWSCAASAGGTGTCPGGRIEVGETAGQAVIREVAKESGVRITLAGLSGDRTYRLAAAQAAGVSEALLVVKRLVRAPAAVAQPPRPGFTSEFISADQSIQRDSKLLDEELHSPGLSSLASALTTWATKEGSAQPGMRNGAGLPAS
jgi:hypothetical protein